MMEIRRTYCGLCHPRCGALLQVEDGRAIKVEGDPDHPISRGRLCARGRLLVDPLQLLSMKQTCQKHCFSTLNHNLAYCYNDARVIKFIWKQAKNRFQGGARSFEDEW